MGDSRCLSGGELCRHRINSLRTDHCHLSGIRRRFSVIPFFYRWKAEVLPSSSALRCRRWLRLVSVNDSGALCKRPSCGLFGLRGFRRDVGTGFRIHAAIDVAGAVDVINDLGLDTLTFLAVTVMVVPAFKLIRASPILGFFSAGVVLNQFGLFRNLTDVKVLSEWGILFLLFEMGLELSLARLKALAKYAFGMGLTQVVLSTLAFTAFELPPNGAFGTKVLEFLFHSRPDLVNIRSVDEAIVIGAALSLSSSAFVLQLLAEKGELPTRFGSATLGILLLQDIAVVPLLVILPILESQNLGNESIWPMLATESLKALGGLGLLSLGGKFLLRRIFEVVAESRSSEAFVALCLLTVAGTSLLTQALGFSDTLGAFLAGALLAETNFRTQIEADIRPFRGLLLGLFFVTTGTSIDMQLLLREWPNVLSLLTGLIVIKTLIITAIGPRVGLTLQESIRIGLLLSQGGEFGFVVFSLANRLGVLPLELNKLLIIIVVLSMALTPLLNEIGRTAAEIIDQKRLVKEKDTEPVNFEATDPVVILGFGQMAQVLANFLSMPLASGCESDTIGWPYVVFDLNLSKVKAARRLGFPILYGDGSRPAVLQSAGISPKAVMVMYTEKTITVKAVQRIRLAFPAFTDENGERQHVWQTSWAISTRFVGGIIMTHGDDTGLMLPPRLAPIQVVIIPIWKKGNERIGVLSTAASVEQILKSAEIKVKIDNSEQRTPGWKFNFWEMKGVPVRIEIGPRDVANGSVVVSRRDVPGKLGKDLGISMEPSVLIAHVKSTLEDVQASLLQRATLFRDRNIVDVSSYEELKEAISQGKWARGPWSASDVEEQKVKEETGATIRCFPFDQPEGSKVCFMTGNPAQEVAIFARSY